MSTKTKTASRSDVRAKRPVDEAAVAENVARKDAQEHAYRLREILEEQGARDPQVLRRSPRRQYRSHRHLWQPQGRSLYSAIGAVRRPCASALSFNSAMTYSTIAWSRCRWSASIMPSEELVVNA